MSSKKPIKNTSNNTEHASNSAPKSSKLKIASVVVVSIFVIIIAAGLMKEYSERPTVASPSAGQVSIAKNMVESSLQATGDDLAAYNVSVSQKVRTVTRNGKSTSTIEVCLAKGITRHVYVIDLNSQKILVHSVIDLYSVDVIEAHHYAEQFDACGVKSVN